jgi:hypothetical protein
MAFCCVQSGKPRIESVPVRRAPWLSISTLQLITTGADNGDHGIIKHKRGSSTLGHL